MVEDLLVEQIVAVGVVSWLVLGSMRIRVSPEVGKIANSTFAPSRMVVCGCHAHVVIVTDITRYMRNTTFSDEDSDDMEANAATIAKEEARAARLAREQDRLEEEMERKRKEEKMKRRAGK